MTASVTEYIKPDELCSVCHKRKGTRLCDYGTTEIQGIMCGKNAHMLDQIGTCDALLCTVCAVKVGQLDFCPMHARVALDEISRQLVKRQ